MEILISIIGLPLMFIGYKIGKGKMLYRDRWYKSFFFWWFRLASLGGISVNIQSGKFLVALLFFLIAGFMWANVLDSLYKKIMNIKDGVTEPFKGKSNDELNEEKISDLQEQIKNTKKDIHTQNQIKALEEQLENLKNPKEPEPEIIGEVKPEPIPEPVKVNPVVEENKKEFKSFMDKMGF